jgi:hypothetical protein
MGVLDIQGFSVARCDSESFGVDVSGYECSGRHWDLGSFRTGARPSVCLSSNQRIDYPVLRPGTAKFCQKTQREIFIKTPESLYSSKDKQAWQFVIFID